MILLLCRLACAVALTLAYQAQAATLQLHLTDRQGQPLANAVVTLDGPPGPPASAAQAVMDQRGNAYVPPVLAIRTGTAVSFPNSDNIRHQVYSFSPAKRFELRLYEGTPTQPVQFDKPGLVVLGCNIHEWMLGYVYVTDAPWFGVTGADGMLRLAGLPAGNFRLTLWHAQSADGQPQAMGTLALGEQPVARDYALDVAPLPDDRPMPPAPSAFGDAFDHAAREAGHAGH